LDNVAEPTIENRDERIWSRNYVGDRPRICRIAEEFMDIERTGAVGLLMTISELDHPRISTRDWT
jgi:hypothetical protein